MKAVVYNRFGPPEVLEVCDISTPTPGDDEVLIRIRATTVTTAEAAMRQGRPWWGASCSASCGRADACGPWARNWPGWSHRWARMSRGFGWATRFLASPASASAQTPNTCGSAKGHPYASSPPTPRSRKRPPRSTGASTALFFLCDKAGVRAGDRVVIVGASGSIGGFAVRLARHFGADVTGVCSTRNVEFVESLGARRVIDYTREDFTRANAAYDIVFDTAGKSLFVACRGTLARGGRYLAATGLVNYLLALWTRVGRGKRVITGI